MKTVLFSSIRMLAVVSVVIVGSTFESMDPPVATCCRFDELFPAQQDRCFDFSPYMPDNVTIEGCHECTVTVILGWNIFKGRISLKIDCVEVDTGHKTHIRVDDHCWAGWFC